MTNRKKNQSLLWLVIFFVISLLPLKQVLQLSQRKGGTPSTHIPLALDIHTCVFGSHFCICFKKAGSELALPSRFSVRENGTVTSPTQVSEEVPAVRITGGRSVPKPRG